MKPRKFKMTSSRGQKRTLAENVRVVADAPIRGDEYQPRVTLFYGRRGNGKSLLATAFAKTHAERWAKTGYPKQVLANFNLSFATHSSADLYAEMTLGNLNTRHSIILFDEVAELMPSMRANTREALDLQSWLKAIRKDGVDLIMTTQRPHEILGMMRFQTDFFISCIDPYRRDPKRKGKVVNASIFDWWGAVSEYPFGSNAPFPQPDENAHWRRKYLNLNRFWDDYDTQEVIRGTYSTANRGRRAQLLARSEGGKYDPNEVAAYDRSNAPAPPEPQIESGEVVLPAEPKKRRRDPDEPARFFSDIDEKNVYHYLRRLQTAAGQPKMTAARALEFCKVMGDIPLP